MSGLDKLEVRERAAEIPEGGREAFDMRKINMVSDRNGFPC